MNAAFVVTSALAEADLEDIAAFIAVDSPYSAERFAVEFNAALERIAAFPQAARRIPRTNNLRIVRVSARFWRYLIVYGVENSGVEIKRILHGAMDITAQLAKAGLA